MQLLVDLYEIYSPSKREYEMSAFVQKQLTEMGIEFDIDEKGQIYRFMPDTPMLAAHMDHVTDKPIKHIWKEGNKIFGDGNLGADDKNGIWIALKLLREFPNTSFIFSVEEECGLGIDTLLASSENELKDIKYCLVFDRRNGSDIVGTYNDYCVDEFEDDLVKIGKSLGFKPAMGTFSDCDAIALFLSCVNISCGYYKAHTKDEYTYVNELYNSLEFGRKILSTIDKKYEAPEVSKWKSQNKWEDEFDVYYCPKCEEYVSDVFTYVKDKKATKTCWQCDTPVEEIIEDIHEEYYCPECKSKIDSYEETRDGHKVCSYCYSDLQEIADPKNIDIYEEYYCPVCDVYWEGEELDDTNCPQCNSALIYNSDENTYCYN